MHSSENIVGHACVHRWIKRKRNKPRDDDDLWVSIANMIIDYKLQLYIIIRCKCRSLHVNQVVKTGNKRGIMDYIVK
ncbi:MAG: hypothetical protein ACTSWN_00675 [Promethearchaeota archaeon]